MLSASLEAEVNRYGYHFWCRAFGRNRSLRPNAGFGFGCYFGHHLSAYVMPDYVDQ